jgi:phosphodiesterase/alkaline phosphatase D-like protein
MGLTIRLTLNPDAPLGTVVVWCDLLFGKLYRAQVLDGRSYRHTKKNSEGNSAPQ